MTNFGAEFAERMETTPFTALPMLAKALENGTTNVGFTYSDRWSNMEMKTTLLSDAANLNFALRGDVTVDGTNIDFSSYINDKRFALSSSLLGGEYYGVVYETAVQDVSRLAGELGIDVSEIEETLGAVVEYLNALIESADEFEALDSELMELMFAFMRKAEQAPEDVGGARRIAYSFTMAEFTNFYRDLVDFYDNNSGTIFAMLDFLDVPAIADEVGMNRAELEREYFNITRSAITEMEKMGGNMTIAIYIGARDRLEKIEMSGTIEVMGETVGFDVTLDLGNSATAPWTLSASATDGYDTHSFELIWSITSGTSNVHTIAVPGLFTLVSDWNPASGAFSMGVAEFLPEFISGSMTVSGDTFSFAYSYEDTFDISVSTSRGANIANVNFKNIGQMSFAELESVVTNAIGVLMAGMMY